jgi:uncharacterized membrane protein
MRARNLIGNTKTFPNILFRILAVVAVIALLMTTKVVSEFVSKNIVKSAKATDIQRESENILLFVSGVILFAFGGLVIFPFFKIAVYVVAVWLVVRAVKNSFFFREKMKP